ncbi:MAG TPA: hypothetical protein VFV50_18640, partial [Bdellovibrionales bacterium]|nr:hypothetical protein [Bdellovibrionales bacterium]
MKNRQSSRLIALESAYWSARAVQPGGDHDSKVFEERVRNENLERAEALCLDRMTDPLQHLRTLISRGHLTEAREAVSRLLSADGADSELLLELARIELYEGAWLACVRAASDGLSLGPIGATKMTLYQVRAAALFELREFASCLRDIEKAETLGHLYPHSNAKFYAQVLRAKIAIHQVQLAQGRSMLEALWAATLRDPQLSRDRLLTLSRAEIDFARVTGASPASWAALSLELALQLGDLLYAALARVDLSVSVSGEPVLAASLEADRHTFARVARLLTELETQVPASATATSIRESKSPRALAHKPAYLLLTKHNVLIDVATLRKTDLRKGAQLVNALRALESGPLSKETFFNAIWGLKKFVPRLHDRLIHQCLFRIR